MSFVLCKIPILKRSAEPADGCQRAWITSPVCLLAFGCRLVCLFLEIHCQPFPFAWSACPTERGHTSKQSVCSILFFADGSIFVVQHITSRIFNSYPSVLTALSSHPSHRILYPLAPWLSVPSLWQMCRDSM